MAIVQKMVNCSTNTTPNIQIPMDKVVGFDKYQVGTDVNDATKQDVGIIFHMDTTSPQREIKLKYPGANTAAKIVTRDASFAAVKAAAAQTTV
jgi:hypothetical protein